MNEAQRAQPVEDIALELISDPDFSRKQIEVDSKPYRAIVKALQAAYAAGAADAKARITQLETWLEVLANGHHGHQGICDCHNCEAIRARQEQGT